MVVPAYNASRFLLRTLESLRAQRYRDWRCVIVDDGSTDDTAEIAYRFAAQDTRFRVVQQANAGLSAARNAGIRALGRDVPFVTLPDSDDLYHGDALGRLVRHLERRPDAVGAFGLAEYMDEDERPLLPGLHPERQWDRKTWIGRRRVALPRGEDSNFTDLVMNSPAWPSIVLIMRTGAVWDAGLYDENISLREDWDMMLRLSRLGPLAALDTQVGWYRRHDANLTRRSVETRVMSDRVFIKLNEDSANDDTRRRIVRRSILWHGVLSGRIAASHLRAHLRARRFGHALRASGGLGWTLVATVVASVRGVPLPADSRRVRMSFGLGRDEPEGEFRL